MPTYENYIPITPNYSPNEGRELINGQFEYLYNNTVPLTGSPTFTSISATTISGDTFYGDGSNLTGVGSLTTSNIISLVDVGSIEAGDIIHSGTSLQGFIEQLLLTTYYPTFTNPTFSLTSNQSNGQEIGSQINITLTYNFSRGSINGKMVGGIWQPLTFQDYRAGEATNYTIEGSDRGTNNTYTLNSFVLSASQTFTGSVTYDEGPQPVDSDGEDYNSPYASGTTNSNRTLTAIYPYFYGTLTGTTKPTKDQSLINGGTKVVGSSTGTITVNFNSTADEYLWFAIPSTSTSKTKWYVNALNNGDIGGGTNLFDSEGVVSVDSPSAYWSGVDYKVYMSNYKSEVTESMELKNS